MFLCLCVLFVCFSPALVVVAITRVVQFKMTLGLPFENEAKHRKMFIPNTTLKFT